MLRLVNILIYHVIFAIVLAIPFYKIPILLKLTAHSPSILLLSIYIWANWDSRRNYLKYVENELVVEDVLEDFKGTPEGKEKVDCVLLKNDYLTRVLENLKTVYNTSTNFNVYVGNFYSENIYITSKTIFSSDFVIFIQNRDSVDHFLINTVIAHEYGHGIAHNVILKKSAYSFLYPFINVVKYVQKVSANLYMDYYKQIFISGILGIFMFPLLTLITFIISMVTLLFLILFNFIVLVIQIPLTQLAEYEADEVAVSYVGFDRFEEELAQVTNLEREMSADKNNVIFKNVIGIFKSLSRFVDKASGKDLSSKLIFPIADAFIFVWNFFTSTHPLTNYRLNHAEKIMKKYGEV